MPDRGSDPPRSPMPPERFALLRQRREAQPGPPPLHEVPRREPIGETSSLAATLLAEAATRSLESGELLLLSEEASLDDLEAAAARFPEALAVDHGVAAPELEPLTMPRLWCPRLWEIFGWEPSLAATIGLATAALASGQTVTLVMSVGHVETFPERVEHLLRIRDLMANGSGGLVVQIKVAETDDMADADEQFASILTAARPLHPDHDRRHALAVARLALGPDVVRAGPTPA